MGHGNNEAEIMSQDPKVVSSQRILQAIVKENILWVKHSFWGKTDLNFNSLISLIDNN